MEENARRRGSTNIFEYPPGGKIDVGLDPHQSDEFFLNIIGKLYYLVFLQLFTAMDSKFGNNQSGIIKKVTPKQMIQVRIGNSEVDFTDEFLDLCASVIVKQGVGEYLVCKERGKVNEGLHIHCFIWWDGQIQTLRKRIKTKLPSLGRGNYSITPNVDNQPVLPVVHDMWKTYACKGERRGVMPVLLYNNMLTPEEVVERHNKYWDTHEDRFVERIAQVETQIVVPLPEPPKRVRKETIVEKVSGFLLDNHHDKEWTLSRADRRLVFDEVMRRLGRMGRTIGPANVRFICNGVHNILSPELFRDDIWSQVYPEF